MRPLALALTLLAAGTGCRTLLLRRADSVPAKVAKFTTRAVLVLPTLGTSELRMQAVALQERVEVSQSILDDLYAICRDATPGSDEARRACWDYQRGQEQHAHLLQGVQQWNEHVQQVGTQMQQQGNEQILRGLHPEPPPALPPIQPTIRCTSNQVGEYVYTNCR